MVFSGYGGFLAAARVEFVYVIRAINEIFEDICKVSDSCSELVKFAERGERFAQIKG